MIPRGLGRITLLVVALEFWSDVVFSQEATPLLEEIRVPGNRLDYGLSGSAAPALIYGRDHFQSFEPQGVGDMLRRVAGVAFSGDIGELEAPQLRGLEARYTQVLINGERVPGNSADRTVLVDRIPAELIERIELIRSPTAAMDSQGIGGTLNLVLKDGTDLQGTDWRLGGLYYPDLDPTARGSAAFSSGAGNDSWSYLVSANLQERLNPKTKREWAFSGDDVPLRSVRADDVRDNIDRALRGTLTTELENLGTLGLRLGYLDSRVDEVERIATMELTTQSTTAGLERRRATQDRLEFAVQLQRQTAAGASLQVSLSGGQFDDRSREQEAELEAGVEHPVLQQFTRADGQALQLSGSFSWQPATAHQVIVGAGVSREERSALQRLLELDEGELVDVTPGNGAYRVDETRLHAYLMDTWKLADPLILEYGVRFEDTGLGQRGAGGRTSESQFEINPSVHLLYQPGSFGQVRVSLARTLRRPAFDEIIPFMTRDTPDEDQITVGNPGLQPESAWGLDVGYAGQFANRRGNFGLNLFYRRIEDKIELTRIDEESFTPRNTGLGKIWGAELDFATPLAFLGLPQVGVYGNYVWTDSRIRDPFTRQTRRFNLQPDTIANLDLYHDLPGLGLSHGISWQTQGKGQDFQSDEIKTVRYGSNLEYYIEKRFDNGFTVRFTANNLLDAKKREQGLLFDGLSDLQDNEIEERVFEREQAEPVFLLTIRGSF